MAFDDISISPQQMAATQGIAQSVADASGSSSSTAQSTDPYMPFSSQNHPILAGVGNVLLNAVQGFAQARMGQDAVGQRLRSQYAMELQDKQFAHQEKLANDQIQQQLIFKAIDNMGSAALNNPKLAKKIGVDKLPAFQAYAKSIDDQKENAQKALIAAHLPAAYANLSPEAQKMLVANQNAQNAQTLAGTKQRTAQIEQNTAITRENAVLKESQVRLETAQAELEKARTDKTDKAEQKLADGWDKWQKATLNRRDALIKNWSPDPTASGGQKHTEQDAENAAKAFNASVRAQAKKAEKDGHPFDPNDYTIQFTPGQDQKGWLGGVTRTPYQITSSPPTANTPTGPEAAPASIANSRPSGVPDNAVHGKAGGKGGWSWVEGGKRHFQADA